MSRHLKILVVLVILAGGFAQGLSVYADQLRMRKSVRENYFLMFAAQLREANTQGDYQKMSIAILSHGLQDEKRIKQKLYGRSDNAPELEFRRNKVGIWTLSESKPYKVDLFNSDQLRVNEEGVVSWTGSRVTVSEKN